MKSRLSIFADVLIMPCIVTVHDVLVFMQDTVKFYALKHTIAAVSDQQ